MKYLLDTNVFRELGKTAPHVNVAAWLKTVDDAELAISALTVREVAKGVARLRRSKPNVARLLADAVAAIFDAYDGRIVPIDRPVAAAWGELLATSERHADDAGIAATARAHDLVIVTRNTRDFRNRGVRLLNPFKSPAETLP